VAHNVFLFDFTQMFALGFYWCGKAYQNWNAQPVVTTITTAGLPVEDVSD
jgi:hypothetical protein